MVASVESDERVAVAGARTLDASGAGAGGTEEDVSGSVSAISESDTMGSACDMDGADEGEGDSGALRRLRLGELFEEELPSLAAWSCLLLRGVPGTGLL